MNVSARKMISGAVLLAVGLGVTAFKGDIPPNLMGFMQVLYSAFVLGNAFEHYTKTVGAKNAVSKDTQDSNGASPS